jgi:hypothetical protein
LSSKNEGILLNLFGALDNLQHSGETKIQPIPFFDSDYQVKYRSGYFYSPHLSTDGFYLVAQRYFFIPPAVNLNNRIYPLNTFFEWKLMQFSGKVQKLSRFTFHYGPHVMQLVGELCPL